MHITRNSIAIMGLLSFLFGGCKPQPASPSEGTAQVQMAKPLAAPPEITSELEVEGFYDLVFYIKEHNTRPDGSQSLIVSGTHKDLPLSFEVVLAPAWREGTLGPGMPLVTYRGKISYRSIGESSDNFLKTLDELYATKLSPTAMSKETEFTAISLEGDPGNLSKGPVKIKLFSESEQNGYAELYTNIELASRRLYINEKDEGYREPLIKAMQAK
jgi:hypothetical protein